MPQGLLPVGRLRVSAMLSVHDVRLSEREAWQLVKLIRGFIRDVGWLADHVGDDDVGGYVAAMLLDCEDAERLLELLEGRLNDHP